MGSRTDYSDYEYLAREQVIFTLPEGTNTVGRVEGIVMNGEERLWRVSASREGKTSLDQYLVHPTNVIPLHDVHAHVSIWSRDCDGEHSSGYVETLINKERQDIYGDIEFKLRIISQVVDVTTEGTLKVREDGATWTEVREEGYLTKEATWHSLAECPGFTDDWQRDYTAERMGY